MNGIMLGVELNCGKPIMVNPTCVGSVEPLEGQEKTRSIINIFGRIVKVRGPYEEVCNALGFPMKAIPQSANANGNGKPGKPRAAEAAIGEPSELTDIT